MAAACVAASCHAWISSDSVGVWRSGVDAELVERVAVGGSTCRAVQAHIAAGPRDIERLDPARAGRGAVDRGPVGAVVRHLDLVRLAVGRLPAQLDVLDRGRLTEVDLDPLRVAPVAGPARGP